MTRVDEKLRDLDEKFMRVVLREAARGAGFVSPNPLVGAVAVKRGRLLGKAYHARYGEQHAEIALLEMMSPSQAKGATVYVNLEPCCHHGKTAPCTDALIRAGVERVVVGVEDPNPLVSGRGIRALRRAGIQVSVGVLDTESRRLNAPFLTFMELGRPWILLKVAQSIDGRIALKSGESRWITGETARREVHRLRAQLDAILVGALTVAEDDPELTVRSVRGRNPIRVVLDSRLRISPRAKVLRAERNGEAWVFTTDMSDARARKKIAETGAELFVGPAGEDGRIDLHWVMKRLVDHRVTSVLVEGGGTVHASFIRAGLYDKLIVATAPMIIGGDGRPAIADLALKELGLAPRLELSRVRKLGSDVWIELEKHVQRNR